MRLRYYFEEAVCCGRRIGLDWNLALSKWDKLAVGLYLAIADYAIGRFPPEFEDEQSTFKAEKAYQGVLPGLTPSEVALAEIRKPFWFGNDLKVFLENFIRIADILRASGICPPMRLLELGCGSGWMTEFLALCGFQVVGTTIDPISVQQAMRRLRGIHETGIPVSLEFRACPMEYVFETVSAESPFDAVLVFEALHHAHDWRKAIRSTHQCLSPGGWFFVLNEPNVLHTLKSYRVARLSNTHEVGISPSKLKGELRATGFKRVICLRHRYHFYYRSLWLGAQA